MRRSEDEKELLLLQTAINIVIFGEDIKNSLLVLKKEQRKSVPLYYYNDTALYRTLPVCLINAICASSIKPQNSLISIMGLSNLLNILG